MNDPDLSVSGDALAVMRRNELVALLNRLYSRCGEPALTTSTAGASSDDELRDRIRGVRRHVLARGSGWSESDSPRTASLTTQSRRPSSSTKAVASPRRPFVVLVSSDQALARRARVSCSARGIVVVWAASQATLEKLVTSVTPTHVFIDHTVDPIEDASARALAARGARVRWCRGAKEMLEALAEIQ